MVSPRWGPLGMSTPKVSGRGIEHAKRLLARGQKLVGKLARGGDIIEASANNAAGVDARSCTHQDGKFAGEIAGLFVSPSSRHESNELPRSARCIFKRARRIMRQRSFQRLMRSEIFLHTADISGRRETDARVPTDESRPSIMASI